MINGNARSSFPVFYKSLLALLLFSLSVNAEVSLKNIQSKVAGYADFARFQTEDKATDGEFLNRTGARWALTGTKGNTSLYASLHWIFWRNQGTDQGAFHIKSNKFNAEMEAAIAHSILGDSWQNTTKTGVYSFKYNSQSRSLGEYLLRTEAYPTILESSQGLDILQPSFTRILGVENAYQIGGLQITGLAYLEQEDIPVGDVSFALISSYETPSFTLGTGVALHRALSISASIKNGSEPLSTFGDSATRSADSVRFANNKPISAKAVKLSAWGDLDVGTFLGIAQDEFNLYGEIAVLGLSSDNLFYTKITERMPVMAGLSLPTFGFLDELSLEVEYLKNPYFNRKYRANATPYSFAYPSLTSDELEGLVYGHSRPVSPSTGDDYKWSFNVVKHVTPFISVHARVASDHLRLRNWDGDLQNGAPITSKSKDRYFLLRIEWHN